ncbi:MAG: hypothetical protein EF811_06545 [Methanonatronarchaeia archaeon]|nr:MAG: hypothetical protein EF811_06545 [Methanonatronarchaeia archaeon]
MHHLIASCVGSKTLEGPQIKNYSGTTKQKAREWIKDLKRNRDTEKAINLYRGGMWNAIQQAYQHTPKPKQLWIVSAGLGLINAQDQVPGYNATFKPNQPNSVANTNLQKTTWWDEITQQNITGGTSTINQLANQLNKNDLLIMTMGKHYYQAIRNDLQKIENKEPEIGLIGIKKQGDYTPKIPSHLQEHTIPYTNYRQLREKLGCSMIQVHPKTTIKTLKHYKKTGRLPENLREIGLQGGR